MSRMDKHKQKHKRSHTLLKFTLLILVILMIGLVVLALNPIFLFTAVSGIPGLISTEQPDDLPGSAPGLQNGETLNLVLLGFDRSAARDSEGALFRPDTIIIASLNLKNAGINMVSIPRDSYVKILAWKCSTRSTIHTCMAIFGPLKVKTRMPAVYVLQF